MTTEEIKRAREICDAATPGPWKVDYGNWQIETVDGRKEICSYHFTANEDEYFRPKEDPHLNAEFIAESRTLLPKALAEIERLKKNPPIIHSTKEGIYWCGCFASLYDLSKSEISDEAFKLSVKSKLEMALNGYAAGEHQRLSTQEEDLACMEKAFVELKHKLQIAVEALDVIYNGGDSIAHRIAAEALEAIK